MRSFSSVRNNFARHENSVSYQQKCIKLEMCPFLLHRPFKFHSYRSLITDKRSILLDGDPNSAEPKPPRESMHPSVKSVCGLITLSAEAVEGTHRVFR